MSERTHEERVAELRQTVERCRDSHDPLVVYLAEWLAFYMEQVDHIFGAWSDSLAHNAAHSVKA